MSTHKAEFTHPSEKNMDHFSPPMEQISQVLSFDREYQTETDEVNDSTKVIIEYTPSSQDIVDSTPPMKSE